MTSLCYMQNQKFQHGTGKEGCVVVTPGQACRWRGIISTWMVVVESLAWGCGKSSPFPIEFGTISWWLDYTGNSSMGTTCTGKVFQVSMKLKESGECGEGRRSVVSPLEENDEAMDCPMRSLAELVGGIIPGPPSNEATPVGPTRVGGVSRRPRLPSRYQRFRISWRLARMSDLYSEMRSFFPSTMQVRFGRGR